MFRSLYKCVPVYLKILFFIFFPLVSFLADIFFADSLSLSSQRDDHRVRVLVCVADLRVFKDVSSFSFFFFFKLSFVEFSSSSKNVI